VVFSKLESDTTLHGRRSVPENFKTKASQATPTTALSRISRLVSLLNGCPLFMNSPIVSVVIPCKDRQLTLERALRSVFAQTFEDFEVIVVDDGSAVPLRAAMFDADARLQFVRHEVNQGAAAARNGGIAAARGRFIAFLDSDDIWLPNKLLQQVVFMNRLANPDYSASFTGVAVYRDGRHIENSPRIRKRPNEKVADFLWLRRGFIGSIAVMVGRAAAASVLFDVRHRIHEDLSWYLALEAAGVSFHHLPETLSVWNNDSSRDRLTHTLTADNWVAWASRVPATHWSPRARAAAEFQVAFLRYVMLGRFGSAIRLAARTVPRLGPVFIFRWLIDGLRRQWHRRCRGMVSAVWSPQPRRT
jgi:glycosyltransferase involved in cell wall biosynthesis